MLYSTQTVIVIVGIDCCPYGIPDLAYQLGRIVVKIIFIFITCRCNNTLSCKFLFYYLFFFSNIPSLSSITVSARAAISASWVMSITARPFLCS